MADDWQIGDLALCVADRLPAPRDKPTKLLKVGRVYTVTSVRWSFGEQCVAIGLAEVQSRGPLRDWHACIFRKIRPLSDIERASFMTDLRLPQTVEA
ncbi:hypothetical protein [Sphingobium sp. WCS2017Hpa-17]|uniref:hypothetical protein n=1 Tax=Sphingobium sp. WCS2017Hpa-17 TaxID=3073638 RepID=UPI00288BEC48|nr:hypothetical protein [Sphingobium sp. WCS2017Hpa-17]